MVSRVGPDGSRQYVSPAATRMFGAPAETLLGRGLLDLIRSEDLPRVDDAARRLLAGAVEEDEAAFRSPGSASALSSRRRTRSVLG